MLELPPPEVLDPVMATEIGCRLAIALRIARCDCERDAAA